MAAHDSSKQTFFSNDHVTMREQVQQWTMREQNKEKPKREDDEQ